MILTNFRNTFLGKIDDKNRKMLDRKIWSKLIKFNSCSTNLNVILIFSWTNFQNSLRFWQNRDFQFAKFCDQVVKFVWQVWCHLVHLTIVTHSQTSPLERSHSSDIESRKNGFKIRHIDLQNTKSKSWPKIL